MNIPLHSVGLGCIFGFLSVALGAFGSHALKERLTADLLAVYQTAVQYQFWHAIALICFGLWSKQSGEASQGPSWCFALGIVVFSGSLYALSLTGIRFFGAITPIGGLLFLAGWAWFAKLAA